ncbi:MAG: hypothetical protein LJE95_16215 [Acidobacteria bacterium]|nr:hypothetical protein [Acidobacteriota bacterium]
MLQDVFVSTSRVRAFVRDVLNCGCPESVFDDVRIGLPTLYDTHDVEGGLEMLVGGRLLVAVVLFQRLADPAAEIPKILERGRQARDAYCFNRFRLAVVGVHDESQRAQLEALASALDDRLHLHLVNQQDLGFDQA